MSLIEAIAAQIEHNTGIIEDERVRRNTMDYEAECGCEYLDFHGKPMLKYCPMHEAASDVLEALESLYKIRNTLEVLGEWAATGTNPIMEAKERAKVDLVMDKVRAAIAKAQPA